MIRKFQRYEEAALFVGEKAAEGYHAYIMNEATGFLWGPRTVGGFRVYVSDEPIPEGIEDLPSPDFDDPVSGFIRILVLSVILVGVIAGGYFVLAALPRPLALAAVLALVIGAGWYFFRRDHSGPRS